MVAEDVELGDAGTTDGRLDRWKIGLTDFMSEASERRWPLEAW